jgi:hypothetical protein
LNLIDFEVLEVLTEPERHTYPDIEFWTIECLTIDEGTKPQKERLSFSTYEKAKEIVKGYRGLH